VSISTLIRRMSELGATPEMIALAVEEIEAIQGDLNARRTADRDRKRAQREREKSANVTGHSGDSHNVVQLRVSLDKEKSPRPPKEINPIPCASRARGAGYHRLPDGWRPTRPFPAELQAKVDQWPPGALNDQIACFKRWAANAPDRAGKGRKKDWDKALCNWLTRVHDERYSRQASNGIGKSQAAYRLATADLDPDEPF
jgi:hypothetical protein